MRIIYNYFDQPIEKAKIWFEEGELKHPGISRVMEFLELVKAKQYGHAVEKWSEIPSNIQTWYFTHFNIFALIQNGQIELALNALEKGPSAGLNYHVLTSKEMEAIFNEYRYKKYMRKRFPNKYDDLDDYDFDKPTPIYYPNNCILLGKFYEKYDEWHRAEFLYHKALELEPDLDAAYSALQTLYQNHPELTFDMDRPALLAKIESGKAEAIHHIALSNLYKYEGEETLAIEQLKRALTKTDVPQPIMLNLARLYADAQEPAQAEVVLDSLLSSDFLSNDQIFEMALIYQNLNLESKVNQALQKGVDLTNRCESVYYFAKLFLDARQMDLVQIIIQMGKEKYPGDQLLYYNNACLYSLANLKEKAIQELELAFQYGYNNIALMKKDSDLDNIRDTSEFNALVDQYFPEKSK